MRTSLHPVVVCLIAGACGGAPASGGAEVDTDAAPDATHETDPGPIREPRRPTLCAPGATTCASHASWVAFLESGAAWETQAHLCPPEIELPRVLRRPVCLSHAARSWGRI